jgi:hypothetical protein
MLGRSCFLAVGVFLWAAAALAGEPIFDSQRGHVWDQARDIFYVRRFSTGEVFEHPHAFAPPWREYQPFVHDAAFYEQVVARLEAVQKLPSAQMEEQPAPRRLILLRDLWPVFDGLIQARVDIAGDPAASAKAIARRDDLLRRVARIMRRLELSEAEVRAIPNAFVTMRHKKAYPEEFDPASPDAPFFPTDLLETDGPWVAYSREEAPSVGGSFHVEFVRHRSIFTLHLRTPRGRDEAVKFLADFRETGGKDRVPAGSTLALVRRALVPTREGTLAPSPFVESLQLIVVTSGHDIRFKYTLDRKEFVAAGTGLKLIGEDDRVDNSDFESGVAVPRIATTTAWRSIPPTESLVLEHYKTVAEMPKSMATCVKCHGDATRTNIFANFGSRKAACVQSDPDEADAKVIKKKEASEEWKSYLRLRTTQAK